MPQLFDPLQINGMRINNRFVRSATMDNMGQNGIVTESQLSLYRELAQGEIGLIISTGIFPCREGQAGKGQLGAHRDETIPSLKKLTDTVHEYGGKVAAQLLHGGWMCHPRLTDESPVGPSPVINPFTGVLVQGMSGDEVRETADGFVQAGRRLIEAGFDAIQLHGAHNWLISSFLSPVTNQREDEFGGSPENRSRFIELIYKGIRKIAGPSYPIFIKLGLKDYHPEGKSLEEGIHTAKMLEIMGMDAIEISEGLEAQLGHHIRPSANSPYYLDECRRVRQTLKLPLILVGGMRKLEDMRHIVESETADAVSMCRPFIADPYIIKQFHERTTVCSACNSCNACVGLSHGNQKCALVTRHA